MPVWLKTPFTDSTIDSLNQKDIVVLSGGHGYPVLWHDQEYKNEIDIINNHSGPIIGICLGFELISHVFGSHLHQLQGRRKGEIRIWPTLDNSIVTGQQNFTVYENHNWSVERLNDPLVALAASDDGIEVMKHASRPIYGMQFHPEGTKGNGGIIMNNILRDIEIS